jgi:hypothetical protein
LEALGPNGEREETQSDSAGNFRIRGLIPTGGDSHYTIRVKTHPESKVERASPLGIQVKIQRQDVQNLNFLVFRKVREIHPLISPFPALLIPFQNANDLFHLSKSAESSISGVVNVNKRDLLDKLQIELYSLGEGNVDDTPIKTLQLGPSNFFDFRGLPVSSVSSRKYTLKLKSTLSNNLYAYTLPSVVVEVPADETNVDVTIDFKAEPHTVHQELTRSALQLFSSPSLPLDIENISSPFLLTLFLRFPLSSALLSGLCCSEFSQYFARFIAQS